MVNDANLTKALGDLHAALDDLNLKHKPGEVAATRDQVFKKYQQIFSTNHIPELTKEEYTSFLYIENNRHWDSLYRRGLEAADDMVKLRDALGILLDTNKPIRDRFPRALDKVKGLGHGIATAILTVAHPEEYGVWNNTSEAALRLLGLWPHVEKGGRIGGRYEKLNDLLSKIKTELRTDFWTLDMLWWYILKQKGDQKGPPPEEESSGGGEEETTGGFRLERQLQVFLLENWDRTPLASEWAIYSTPEGPDPDEFPTDVGRIDILAVHKRDEKRFLVIELKRGRGSRQAVGQLLEYMGWVKERLAGGHGTVEGLIIAQKADRGALYALSNLRGSAKFMTYEVEFRLKEAETADPA
jgi:hypothetical protein